MPQFTRADIRNILGEAHTDEIENRLIALHLSVVDPLKDDVAKYKADAEKLPDLQKQLDDIKGGEDYKAKYEAEHKAFDDYKAGIAKKEQLSKVQGAYRKLLEANGIDPKRIDTVVRATSFEEMKLGDDGKLQGESDLVTAINKDWADFKVSTRTRGANPANPPKDNNGGNGANSRAAELARKYHESRYGKAPDTGAEQKKE